MSEMGGKEEEDILNGIIHKAIKKFTTIKGMEKRERENETRDQNHFSDNHRNS